MHTLVKKPDLSTQRSGSTYNIHVCRETIQLKRATQERADTFSMSRLEPVQCNAGELVLNSSAVLTAEEVQQILATSSLTSLRANAHHSSRMAATQLLALPLLKLELEAYDALPVLSSQNTLTNLTLGLCNVPTEVLDAVVRNNPLREVSLALSRGFTSLRSLSEKSTLTSLNISGYGLAGGTPLPSKAVRLLCLNSSITSLNLAHNKLTDETIVPLARNTNLVVLGVSYNSITSKGITLLLRNASIEELYIKGCAIDEPIPFESNTTLHRLEMTTPYPLTIDNVRALAANTTLTHLTANIDNDGCGVLETGNTSLISVTIIHPLDNSMFKHAKRNLAKKLNHTAMLMAFCILVRRAYSR